MADEMTNYVLKDIKYRLDKKTVPKELQDDTFRKDIRDTMIAFLGRFAGGIE